MGLGRLIILIALLTLAGGGGTPATAKRTPRNLPQGWQVVEIELELTPKQEVIKIAESRSFLETEKLLDIIWCESRFKPNARKVNTNGTIDRGIAQFNDYWHPEVSDECAYSVNCSINKMIDIYKDDGSFRQWRCNQIIE